MFTRTSREGHRRPHGFTLIELLVVISIVALLIAILLPSLSSARNAAQTAVCLSNVRQFVTAVHLYAVEHDDEVPAQLGQNLQMQGATMPGLHDFAPNYLNGGDVLICPTADTVSFKGTSRYNPRSRTVNPASAFWNVVQGSATANHNLPHGTYYYYAGALMGWDSQKYSVANGYTMRISQTVPSKYGVTSDWDGTRRGSLTNDPAVPLAYSPHRANPGRTHGFLDGHARFEKRTAEDLGWASLPETTGFYQVTGRVTPVLQNFGVRYNPNFFTQAEAERIVGIR
jgi:prepilin-type N-terminal cleavage/methylation domain-containing protein